MESDARFASIRRQHSGPMFKEPITPVDARRATRGFENVMEKTGHPLGSVHKGVERIADWLSTAAMPKFRYAKLHKLRERALAPASPGEPARDEWPDHAAEGGVRLARSTLPGEDPIVRGSPT